VVRSGLPLADQGKKPPGEEYYPPRWVVSSRLRTVQALRGAAPLGADLPRPLRDSNIKPPAWPVVPDSRRYPRSAAGIVDGVKSPVSYSLAAALMTNACGNCLGA
jgi:hypothetical protein